MTTKILSLLVIFLMAYNSAQYHGPSMWASTDAEIISDTLLGIALLIHFLVIMQADKK